jgi:hypothetical protein
MSSKDDKTQKIGAGHAAAFFRQGLRELRAALYPDSNVAQAVSEYGLYGTRTPGEVAESRRNDGHDLEEEAPNRDSVLADRLQQAKDRDDRDDHSKDLDRE